MRSKVITADEVWNLGEASDACVGRYVVEVIGGGTYAITVRKKVMGGSVANASANATAYTNALTGAAITAGTTITAAGIYEIDCSGCMPILDIDWTSGALTLEVQPVLG